MFVFLTQNSKFNVHYLVWFLGMRLWSSSKMKVSTLLTMKPLERKQHQKSKQPSSKFFMHLVSKLNGEQRNNPPVSFLCLIVFQKWNNCLFNSHNWWWGKLYRCFWKKILASMLFSPSEQLYESILCNRMCKEQDFKSNICWSNFTGHQMGNSVITRDFLGHRFRSKLHQEICLTSDLLCSKSVSGITCFPFAETLVNSQPQTVLFAKRSHRRT